MGDFLLTVSMIFRITGSISLYMARDSQKKPLSCFKTNIFVAMTSELYIKVYAAVKSIPKGKVATYKQIAEMVGNSKMARAVGNALHRNPDHSSIPCHRVVNTKGELSKAYAFGGLEGQKKFLQEEGIEVIDEKVDLSKFGI